MKAVVCFKQVPEPGSIRISEATQSLKRDGVNLIINPFDQYAIEEVIRVKERETGTAVSVSVGDDKVVEALRESIAMGVDDALLLTDPSFTGSDTLATAHILAQGLKKLDGFDLVILGKQTADGATAQVGPQLAEELDLPHVTNVRKIVSLAGGKGKFERLTDYGVETVEASLPVVITVVKEINEPRLPSLKGIMKAKKTEIKKYSAGDLGVDASRVGEANALTKNILYSPPPARGKGELLGGDVSDQVKSLVAKLREAKVV